MDVIVGAGKTGASCARYLAARGVPFRVADDNPDAPGMAEIRSLVPDVECAPVAQAELSNGNRLIVSPGVPLAREEIAEAIRAGVPVTGDVAIFCDEAKAPFIGVTGSNGKSTVTTLLGRMAEADGKRAVAGGNLGTPCLDLLADAIQLYVIEMSSFQLETAVCPGADVAVLLNVSPDHMDRYPDFAAYRAAKLNIFGGCRAAVIARGFDVDLDAELWTFGDDPARGLRETGLADGSLLLEGEPVIEEAELRVAGRHNVLNVLACLAAGRSAGLGVAAMCEAARSFPGLPHRTEWVAEIDGVTYLNDSKATNPGATMAAVQGFADRPLKLLLGGQRKGADFTALATALLGANVEAFVFGEDADVIRRALPAAVTVSSTMREALGQARARARAGDTVLLSPACASFDEFSGYAERGDAFAEAVREGSDV